MKKKLLECLFGHHQYSKELTKDKDGRDVRLCKICRRVSRWTWFGTNTSVDYDGEGNARHIKYHDGYKLWKDDKGRWKDAKGNWKI